MGVHYHKRPIASSSSFMIDAGNKLCNNVADVKNISIPTETGTFDNNASVVNNLYVFDGVDDKINFGSSSRPQEPQGDYTVSHFVKFDTLGTDNRILKWAALIDGGNDYVLTRITTANKFEIRWKNISGNSLGINTSSQTFLANQVYCISFTVVGIVVTMYVDGVLISSSDAGSGTSSARPLNLSTEFTVGGHSISSAAFNGSIGNVIIWDRALTAAEINQNYETQKSRYAQ